MIEISRIVGTRHISPEKIQVRLNREGGIYGNSRRHSQLLRDYVPALCHPEMELKAPTNDLDFFAVLRPRLRKGCGRQNQYINAQHTEVWEPLFIIERVQISIIIFRSLLV